MNNVSVDEKYEEAVFEVNRKKQRLHISDKELNDAQNDYIESVTSAEKLSEKAEKEKNVLVDIVKATGLILIYVLLSLVNEWLSIVYAVSVLLVFAVYKFFGDKIKERIDDIKKLSFPAVFQKVKAMLANKTKNISFDKVKAGIKNISFDKMKNKIKKIPVKKNYNKLKKTIKKFFSKHKKCRKTKKCR